MANQTQAAPGTAASDDGGFRRVPHSVMPVAIAVLPRISPIDRWPSNWLDTDQGP